MKEFEEVTLLDEDGKECRFTHLATIEHEGSYYIALEPLDDPKAAPPEDLELEDDEEVLTVMLLKINMNEDEDGQDAYELVEDVPSDAARQVREKNLASYDHYQYKVVPYRTIEGVQYTGVESFSEEIIVTAPKVYIASVTEQEGGGIRLQWSMRSQSDGYVIYRREEGQSFVLLREIREGQKRLFIDKNVVSGKTYQYYVAAYVEEPYGPVYSNYQISSPFTYTGS